jgi:hypothetical protein
LFKSVVVVVAAAAAVVAAVAVAVAVVVIIIQFNSNLLTCQLNSAVANYKASTT